MATPGLVGPRWHPGMATESTGHSGKARFCIQSKTRTGLCRWLLLARLPKMQADPDIQHGLLGREDRQEHRPRPKQQQDPQKAGMESAESLGARSEKDRPRDRKDSKVFSESGRTAQAWLIPPSIAILAASDPAAEWDEARLKAAALLRAFAMT